MALIDDFEDNDLSEYVGDTADFTTSTSVVHEGTYSLLGNTNGEKQKVIISSSGLDHYPSAGDKMVGYVTANIDGSPAYFLFGLSGTDIATTDGYQIQVSFGGVDGGRLYFDRIDAGSVTGITSSLDHDMPFPEWYKVAVDWGTDGTFNITVDRVSTNTTVIDVTTTDSTYTSGNCGFGYYSSNYYNTGSDYWAFDGFHTEPVSSFTLVDSFEDGDHSRYSTTANILSEGASANAIDGSNTITVSNVSNYAFAYEFAVDTTAGVGPGSRIRCCQTAVNGNSYSSGFMYGSPSLGSGYAVIYRGSGIDLYRFDSGAPTRLVYKETTTSGPAYMEVDFASDGTHTIKLYDDSSYTSPVHEITATDSTYSAGGVGFSSYNGISTYGSYEIDKIEYEPLGGGGGSSPPAAPTGLTLTQL